MADLLRIEVALSEPEYDRFQPFLRAHMDTVTPEEREVLVWVSFQLWHATHRAPQVPPPQEPYG